METLQALDNLDEILSIAVAGLGAVYFGPFDLSYALGCQPQPDNYGLPVMEAIEHILDCSKKYGIPAAIHCMENHIRQEGFNLVTTGCNADFIQVCCHTYPQNSEAVRRFFGSRLISLE